jgi:chromosomal replication initiator protein
MACPPQVERAASALVPTAAVWSVVLRRLREELSPFALEAWIDPIVAEPTGDGLRLLCPTEFHCGRVRERHLLRIEALFAEAGGGPRAVTLGVAPRAAAGERVGAEAGETASTVTGPPGAASRPERVPAASPPLRPDRARIVAVRSETPAVARACEPPSHDFASFVTGPANALAREACLALARGRQLAMSPLCVVARTGLGKTHLAGALLREVRARGGDRAAYVSGEQFTNELGDAIRSQRTGEFKRRYREACDVLVFDDVHFLRGKRQTQLELLHTLEHLARRGARVMITSERLPREIPDLDPRLASWLTSGLCAEIEPPDPALRRAVLTAKASAAGFALPPPCLERLAAAVTGSVRDLESALVQVIASASLLRRPIDAELVDAALRKVLPGTRAGGLEPERIAELVAAHFGVPASALGARSRRREHLVPRQVAMYLCTRYTDASLHRIGQCFGRNHPSVANAVRAVERAAGARPALRERLAALAAEIDALAGGGRRGPRRARP